MRSLALISSQHLLPAAAAGVTAKPLSLAKKQQIKQCLSFRLDFTTKDFPPRASSLKIHYFKVNAI